MNFTEIIQEIENVDKALRRIDPETITKEDGIRELRDCLRDTLDLITELAKCLPSQSTPSAKSPNFS